MTTLVARVFSGRSTRAKPAIRRRNPRPPTAASTSWPGRSREISPTTISNSVTASSARHTGSGTSTRGPDASTTWSWSSSPTTKSSSSPGADRRPGVHRQVHQGQLLMARIPTASTTRTASTNRTFSYQWYHRTSEAAAWTAIAGVMGAAFTPTAGHINGQSSVVTFTRRSGHRGKHRSQFFEQRGRHFWMCWIVSTAPKGRLRPGPRAETEHV